MALYRYADFIPGEETMKKIVIMALMCVLLLTGQEVMAGENDPLTNNFELKSGHLIDMNLFSNSCQYRHWPISAELLT